MSDAVIDNSALSPPKVASFWVGKELGWLHSMCLASFVFHGHEVTLFYAGSDGAPAVPDGVRTAPAAEVWDPAAHGHGEAPASMVSDLFRLYLLKQTDMMWIDTDVLCLRPFPDTPYHIGKEPSGTINGAVLRLPKQSKTLNALIEWFEDPEFVPHWMNAAQQAHVAAAPPGQRLLAAFKHMRPSIGPRALANTIRKMGEAKHLSPPEVYYPVRGVFTDIFFNPSGGVTGSLSPDTLCVHLYASMIRKFHLKHQPHPDCFIAQCARDIEFDIAV